MPTITANPNSDAQIGDFFTLVDQFIFESNVTESSETTGTYVGAVFDTTFSVEIIGRDLVYTDSGAGLILTGGTIDTLTFFVGGELQFTVTDANIDAAALSAAVTDEVVNGDEGAVEAFLFSLTYIYNGGDADDIGGSDTVTANDIQINLLGDDILNGNGGNDELFGGDGNDMIFGGVGNDILEGGNGDDDIYGGEGVDINIGGAGDDRFFVTGQADLAEAEVFDGGEGIDTIFLNRGATTGSVIYNLEQLSSNSIETVTFTNTDAMTSGSVELFLSAAEVGGLTFNTQDMGDINVTLTINLSNVETLDLDATIFGEGVSIVNVIGGSGNDTITASATQASYILGGGGNDRLTGVDGLTADLDGEAGDDIITGADANDFLSGGAGDDSVSGNEGDDVIDGGTGNDLLLGDSGNDLIRGGAGNDQIFLGLGDDVGFGGDGNDEIIDTILSGDDEIHGGNGDDIITIGAGDNMIFGDAGNDELFLRSVGGGTLDGGEGVDTLRIDDVSAVTVNLAITGAQLFGNGSGVTSMTSVENIIATSFDDNLTGSAVANVIDAGAGNDSLFGDISAAADLAAGSVEAQVFRAYQAVLGRTPDLGGFAANVTNIIFGVQTQADLIASFVGSAEFAITYGDLSTEDFVATLFTNVLPNNTDQAARAAFANRIDNDADYSREDMVAEFTNTPEFVAAMALPSAAFASSVLDVHPDEASVFRIYQAVFDRAPDAGGFTAFTDALQGDALSVAQITAQFVDSEEFNLTYGDLNTTDFVETLYTNVLPGNTDAAGRAAFISRLDNDPDYDRADMVTDFVNSPEFISRQAEAAAAFVADVYADAGDTLIGGTGDDVMFGGRGADTFVYDAGVDGADIVLDFALGTDTLEVDGVADFAALIAAGAQIGNDAVFDFGDGNTLTLNNVTLSELTADDVDFDGSNSAAKADIRNDAAQTDLATNDDALAADIAYWDADFWVMG